LILGKGYGIDANEMGMLEHWHDSRLPMSPPSRRSLVIITTGRFP